jgi:hypothetical protein
VIGILLIVLSIQADYTFLSNTLVNTTETWTNYIIRENVTDQPKTYQIPPFDIQLNCNCVGSPTQQPPSWTANQASLYNRNDSFTVTVGSVVVPAVHWAGLRIFINKEVETEKWKESTTNEIIERKSIRRSYDDYDWKILPGAAPGGGMPGIGG